MSTPRRWKTGAYVGACWSCNAAIIYMGVGTPRLVCGKPECRRKRLRFTQANPTRKKRHLCPDCGHRHTENRA